MIDNKDGTRDYDAQATISGGLKYVVAAEDVTLHSGETYSIHVVDDKYIFHVYTIQPDSPELVFLTDMITSIGDAKKIARYILDNYSAKSDPIRILP